MAFSLTQTQATAFKAKTLNDCIDSNLQTNGPDGTYLPSGAIYVSPAVSVYRPYGQFQWDSAFQALVATMVGASSDLANAQQWMLNWGTRQRRDAPFAGALPSNVYPGGEDFTRGNPPLLPWATLELYRATGDATWLAAAYSICKGLVDFWYAGRSDPALGNLALWGCHATSGDVYDYCRMETGQDNVGLFQNATVGDGSYAELLPNPGNAALGYVVTLASPDLNSWLAMAEDAVGQMAQALGNAADAATYSARAAARHAAMDKFLWDDTAGRYVPTDVAAIATPAGTAAAAASGAAAVTLTAPGPVVLPPGILLRFAGGAVGTVVAYTVIGTSATAVPLTASGLSGAVAGGEAAVSHKRATWQTLANLVAPLWAGVPTQARADLIAADLATTYDGTVPDTYDLYLGSSLRHAVQKVIRGVAWSPFFFSLGSAVTINPANFEVQAGTAQAILLIYRWTAAFTYNAPGGSGGWASWMASGVASIPQSYMYLDETDEQVTAANPLVVTVAGIQTGTCQVTVEVLDKDGNHPLPLQAVSFANGVATATFAPSGSAAFTPGYVNLGASGGTGTVQISRVSVTTRPRGWKYRNPGLGLTCQPRFQFTVSPPVDRAAINNGTSPAGVADLVDYWHECWPNLEYMAWRGLAANNHAADGASLANDVLRRAWTEAQPGAAGSLCERYSLAGQGKGATQYGWAGVVYDAVAAATVADPVADVDPGEANVRAGVTYAIGGEMRTGTYDPVADSGATLAAIQVAIGDALDQRLTDGRLGALQAMADGIAGSTTPASAAAAFSKFFNEELLTQVPADTSSALATGIAADLEGPLAAAIADAIVIPSGTALTAAAYKAILQATNVLPGLNLLDALAYLMSTGVGNLLGAASGTTTRNAYSPATSAAAATALVTATITPAGERQNVVLHPIDRSNF